MTRALSTAFRNEIESPQSGINGVVFAQVSHASLAAPLRLNSDDVDYIYLSQRWTGVSFKLGLLSDDERPPRAQGNIMNINREVGFALLDIDDAATVSLILLSGGDFGAVNNALSPPARQQVGTPVVQYRADNLKLRNARIDALNVSFELVANDYSADQFPSLTASKARCPGLYR
jgi:hypothetical protein